MGVSTDGQLNYGIVFPEGFTFPWDTEDEDTYDGIEDWWRKVNGYQHPYEIFTPKGEYINGIKPAADIISKYFEHERQWEKKHPLPVELINYCSCDYPMYMLAVPGGYSNSRGAPQVVCPNDMLRLSDTKVAAFSAFIDKYIKPCVSDEDDIDFVPNWYLSSLWC